MNTLCSCALETEKASQFFTCCRNYGSLCKAFTNKLRSVNYEIVSLRSTAFSEVILYSDKKLNDKLDHQMFSTITKYTKSTQRFEHAVL